MPKNILIVEDDKAQAYAYERALSESPYKLQFAATCEEALDLVAKNIYALLIVDIMLPSIHYSSGLDIVKIVRASENNKNAKIMVITALDDKNTLEQIKTLKVDAYFTKTKVTLKDIFQKIKELLVA